MMTYDIPGFPPQEKKMSLNREEFIENVIAGRQAIKDYTSSVALKNSDVSGDSKRATIKTEGRESGGHDSPRRPVRPVRGAFPLHPESFLITHGRDSGRIRELRNGYPVSRILIPENRAARPAACSRISGRAVVSNSSPVMAGPIAGMPCIFKGDCGEYPRQLMMVSAS